MKYVTCFEINYNIICTSSDILNTLNHFLFYCRLRYTEAATTDLRRTKPVEQKYDFYSNMNLPAFPLP